MRCVIIDDEPLAIEIIENYLSKIDDMTIIGKFNNSVKAVNFLNENEVDLIFLDIEMPNLNGIELAKTVNELPIFIFTTAYPQYALEGFNLNAVDYLVKPIPFQRFLQAITKAQKYHKLDKPNLNQNEFIFIKSEYDNIKIMNSNITYIEGLKDYIKIYINDQKKPMLTLMSFNDILDKLNDSRFIRVHKSYIVNKAHITTMNKSSIFLNDKRIPIGETFRKKVIKDLGV